MAKAQNGNALVPAGQYSALAMPPEKLGMAIKDNLGNQKLTRFDLESIKVPGSGGKTWQIETLEGSEAVPAITGVIVTWRDNRGYWKESFARSGGGTPPDCQSDDAIWGIGDPGGDCATCRFAQFGSAVREDGTPGAGQACKLVRLLFVLQEKSLLPAVITCPPGSLKLVRSYFRRLTSEAIPYHHVLTRFTLENDRSETNILYSQINPTLAGRLSEEEIAKVAEYMKLLQPSLNTVRAMGDDFDARS